MTSFFHSPWSAVILGILGLSLGYVVFIQNHGDAFAAGGSCPMKELCRNGDCADDPDCKDGKCGVDCPGNCGKNKASYGV